MTLVFVVACSSFPKALVQPPPQDYLLLKGARQLTFEGANDSPRFSPGGDRLLFLSSQRSSHSNTQVYEFEILRNNERRITFQDGEIRNPSYVGDDQIMYASTTDEIKENIEPNMGAKNAALERPPTELYQSDLYGNEILRLTFFPGYDDEAIDVPGPRPYLLFTSFRNNLLGIYKYDLKTKSSSPLLVEKDRDKFSPTISTDHKNLAWIEKDLEKKTYALLISPLKSLKPRILKQDQMEWRDLHFTYDGTQLIYSAQRKNENVFHIEIYDFEKKCTQIVFSGLDSLIQPSYSPGSPNRVIFTRVMKNTRQIYLVDIPPDLGPCLESLH